MYGPWRWHGPSITTQISPGFVTLLQSARRASVLGHLSILRPHCYLFLSVQNDRRELIVPVYCTVHLSTKLQCRWGSAGRWFLQLHIMCPCSKITIWNLVLTTPIDCYASLRSKMFHLNYIYYARLLNNSNSFKNTRQAVWGCTNFVNYWNFFWNLVCNGSSYWTCASGVLMLLVKTFRKVLYLNRAKINLFET